MASLLCVSRGGYYSWLTRPESRWKRENRELVKIISKIHVDSRGTYGSPRIHAELKAQNVMCGYNRVARLMREFSIRAKAARKFKATTNSKHKNPVAPNILARNFNVSGPNKAWVSDITYIYTEEGWLYLCVVIDLFGKTVIGYSMGNRCNQDLVSRAFLMACQIRNPGKKVIFHSDRGVQYTAKKFQKLLKKRGFICSMSRKGDCWDNACAESFFHTLKVEEVHGANYRTRQEARRAIFDYIHVFYNRKRRHSSLGYMSPYQYEKEYSA